MQNKTIINVISEDQKSRIKRIYEQAEEKEKEKIDSILISLTGFSLLTILEEEK